MLDLFKVTSILPIFLFLKKFISRADVSTDFLCYPGKTAFRAKFLLKVDEMGE